MRRSLPLPRGWKRRVRSFVLHILDLGHYHLLEQRTFARHTWFSTPPDMLALKPYWGELNVRNFRGGMETSASSKPD